eukprot:CAMPEP_0183735588 /NCGR_PEP_ID=MMETSP0737-20130205/47122_1 /TAXON_ID=385413 /ORGANISM="Thalassiosira miniscula, Strain CCMP1093" /LENGTH=905 /DNA_ID=CAMNT_0025969387 /DNA_START=173 /DNA_END=2890 /DNA_ORIENTATION=+
MQSSRALHSSRALLSSSRALFGSESNLYGSVDEDVNGGGESLLAAADEEEADYQSQHISFDAETPSSSRSRSRQPILYKHWKCVERAASQIPAIALVTVFHLMVGIPFGVSYFPVGWKSSISGAVSPEGSETASQSHEGFVLDGSFPISGKEAFGIRMFLFSTIIGQLVLTYASNFPNCIALQMVENVPFCQALTYIVVENQGYGKEALSTLFFLFGMASVIVGIVFYALGRANLGRVLYFFPAHVLVGCIGGIGIFIAKTGLEVTANVSFSFDLNGCRAIVENFHLLLTVLGFEAGLRLTTHLTKDGSGAPKYPLLSPIYFISITPIFYAMFWLLGKSLDDEYFFPSLTEECSGNSECDGGPSAWDIFGVIDLSTVSWAAVGQSIPTMIALVMFSLIHVPINIPAFAVSTNLDVNMNIELMAHGYSNGVVGIFGGVQNYMAYTQSIIYYKSGGNGRSSSIAIALSTTVLYFIGPQISTYLPRCMAGTLLLHCGIDLFLEGTLDSYGDYDYLEYTGIWAIVVVMTFAGMEAALVAGAISALLTYAIQSIAYPKPIRGSMTAATLRSSEWNRSQHASEILDNDVTGRMRVRVVQFQGHLFFGNVSLFSDGVKELIRSSPFHEAPYVIIIDFTLVLGIDSSAAQAIVKLRDSLTKEFGIKLSIFVPGRSQGFPCETNLSGQLNSRYTPSDQTPKGNQDNNKNLLAKLTGSTVCSDLDEALVYAEDALIAMENPELLYDNIKKSFLGAGKKEVRSIEEEMSYALELLESRCSGAEMHLVERFFSYFTREVYQEDDVLWKQGTKSDSAKLLVAGALIASLENEAGTTETVSIGSIIGESGLVDNHKRNSTVHALEDNTIVYSLRQESWEDMKEKEPKVANLLYAIVVHYLTLRVQHVSNRIFETRCLPI